LVADVEYDAVAVFAVDAVEASDDLIEAARVEGHLDFGAASRDSSSSACFLFGLFRERLERRPRSGRGSSDIGLLFGLHFSGSIRVQSPI